MAFARRSLPLLLFCLLVFSHKAPAQTAPVTPPQDRAVVETFLHKWHDTHLVTDDDFAPLKALGSKILPLLSEYLSDKELGFEAEGAMVKIDPRGATPYLLKNLLAKDPNIQRDTFRLANRQLQEYDWYARAGRPKADPNAPVARYPANTEPYPYRDTLHDAAIARLTATTPGGVGAEDEAILTVGLTGNRHDIPLLRKYQNEENGRYRTNVLAALARLGDKQALDVIASDLGTPVHPQPAAPFYRDSGGKTDPKPGEMVTPLAEGQRIRAAAFEAGFSMNRRFVTMLVAHLDDPPGQFHGDYGDPSPAQFAMDALAQIVDGKEYGVQSQRSPEDWKTWDRAHKLVR